MYGGRAGSCEQGQSSASLYSVLRRLSTLLAMMVYPARGSAKPTMSKHSISASTQQHLSPVARRSVEANGVIIGSVLGGTALLLISLFIILFPVWRRRCARDQARQGQPSPRCTPSRQCNLSRTRAPSPPNRPAVLPVTPPPRPLAIDVATPPRWHLEKAGVHTPSGHPAITFRSDILAAMAENDHHGRHHHQHHQRHHHRHHHHSSKSHNEKNHTEPREASAAPVSSAFAAEMSSLLESISLKSSYSSLRSGGLAAPPRLQVRRPPAGGEGERRGIGHTAARADSSGAIVPEDGGGGGPPRAIANLSSDLASHVLFERPGTRKWKQEGSAWRTW